MDIESHNGSIYICIPTISIRDLIKIKYIYSSYNLVIYYDRCSLILKGLIILLRSNEEAFLKFISNIFKFSINKIGDANSVKDYSNIQLESMEQTTEFIDELIPQLKRGRAYKWLSKIMGDIPAEAFMVKNMAHFVLFPNLLAVNVCYAQLCKPNNFITISDYFGSSQWYNYFHKQLSFANIQHYKQGWYRVLSLFSSIVLILQLTTIFIKFIWRRGITIKTPVKQNVNLIAEFIDPKRLNNTSYDADYFVDSQKLPVSEILFFLTDKQLKILQGDNYNINEIKDLFLFKKYSLLILDEKKYTFGSLMGVIQLFISFTITTFLISDKQYWAKIFVSAWEDYLDFLPLFDSTNSKKLLYFTFPNGRTEFRFNDGLITGMCRKSNIQSIGIQSRTIYTTKYEDCFDCFDKYLSWGTAWENISPKRTKYINETIQVGCLYTDDLRSNLDNKEIDKFRQQWLGGNKYLISVFDSDIGNRSHYTFEYARSFILSIGKLAQKHLDCTFIIKTKNPEKNKIYLEDPKIKELFNQSNQNIHFLNKGRNDYSNVLNSSDIVIAIGYTTPGFEALSLGKRAIYFSQLKTGGLAFKGLPYFVATNFKELDYIFNKSLLDYKEYTSINSSEIELLDQHGETEIKHNIVNTIVNLN